MFTRLHVCDGTAKQFEYLHQAYFSHLCQRTLVIMSLYVAQSSKQHVPITAKADSQHAHIISVPNVEVHQVRMVTHGMP